MLSRHNFELSCVGALRPASDDQNLSYRPINIISLLLSCLLFSMTFLYPSGSAVSRPRGGGCCLISLLRDDARRHTQRDTSGRDALRRDVRRRRAVPPAVSSPLQAPGRDTA